MCYVLPQDIFIQERVERILIQQNTPIGIVADTYLSWFWQVGNLGKVRWMRGRADLPDVKKTICHGFCQILNLQNFAM